MALDRAKTVQQAEKYVKAGKLADAITAYKKLADDNPRDLNVFNKLGDLCVRANKTPDAIRYFLRIAEFYAKDGFLLKAIAMYKKICKLDPSNMDCVQKLAGLYQQQGLTIEAKAQYLQVVDQLIKSSQFKKAADVLPNVLEIEPDNIKVRLSYADLLVRTNSKDDAAKEFARVARELAAKGMNDEAQKVMQKGLKAVPGHPELTSVMLAVGPKGKKNPAELLASVEAMAKANGDNPRSQAMLAEAYLSAGKRDQAETVVSRLMALGEGAPPEVALAVGRFRLAEEDADGAREWLSRAADGLNEASRQTEAGAAMDEFLKAFPDDREGLARRAAVAERAGDRKSQVSALHRLTQVLVRASDLATAREVARRLIDLDPDNERFAELLQELESEPAAGPSAPPEPASMEDLAPAADVDAEPVAVGGAAESGEEEGDDEVDDEYVSEHFTEAEVFIKYGLLEKAKQQLLAILAKYPRHVASHVKLKEIYVEEGTRDKAAEECLALADLMKAKGREDDARDLINEAIRIDPNNPRVKQSSAQAAAAAPAAAAAAQAPPPAQPEPAAPLPPPAAPPAAAPVAEAPPELAIEDNSGATISLQAAELAPSADDMEIQIDLGEEAAEPAPPPARSAPDPEPAPAPAASRPKPEPIEEETPEDLAALAAGGADESFSIEIDDDLPVASVASPQPPSADPDPEKLGEVDFYIDQGLLEEAREVLFQLHKQYPESREVAERFARANRPVGETPAAEPPKAAAEPGSDIDLDVERAFGAQSLGGSATEPEPAPRGAKAKPVFKVEETAKESEGDFFDLASELDKSLAEAQVAVEGQQPDAPDGPGHSLEEIFKAFKKGVEQQVESSDYETHYNLGIAYKEMGLVDEAIGEFQFAARDRSRTVECCGILGLCFRDKGMPELALKWYRKGLDTPGLGEHESLGLRYDIAEVYREQGDYQKALQTYTEVYGTDSNYRDVATKLKEVRKLLG